MGLQRDGPKSQLPGPLRRTFSQSVLRVSSEPLTIQSLSVSLPFLCVSLPLSLGERVKEKFLWLSPRNVGELIVPAEMPQLTKLYTMEEASQHSSKDDCWIVIDGKVFSSNSSMASMVFFFDRFSFHFLEICFALFYTLIVNVRKDFRCIYQIL